MKILLFWLLPSLLLAQDPWKDIYKASAWEERDQWQKADQIIEHLKLKAGDQVADVGCHEGYMSFKLSAVVGKAGKVFAVDVEQSKIDRLNTNIKDRNVTNITAVKGDYDDPKLTSAVDGVLILDTYHEMDDHDEILKKIKAALKPGGRLVICEAIAKDRRNSSRSVQEGKHELGMNFVVEDLERAGFTILSKKDPFVDREKIKGDVMWLIVATL